MCTEREYTLSSTTWTVCDSGLVKTNRKTRWHATTNTDKCLRQRTTGDCYYSPGLHGPRPSLVAVPGRAGIVVAVVATATTAAAVDGNSSLGAASNRRRPALLVARLRIDRCQNTTLGPSSCLQILSEKHTVYGTKPAVTKRGFRFMSDLLRGRDFHRARYTN